MIALVENVTEIDESLDDDVWDISDHYHELTQPQAKGLAPNADLEFERCGHVNSDGELSGPYSSGNTTCPGFKGYGISGDWNNY